MAVALDRTRGLGPSLNTLNDNKADNKAMVERSRGQGASVTRSLNALIDDLFGGKETAEEEVQHHSNLKEAVTRNLESLKKDADFFERMTGVRSELLAQSSSDIGSLGGGTQDSSEGIVPQPISVRRTLFVKNLVEELGEEVKSANSNEQRLSLLREMDQLIGGAADQLKRDVSGHQVDGLSERQAFTVDAAKVAASNRIKALRHESNSSLSSVGQGEENLSSAASVAMQKVAGNLYNVASVFERLTQRLAASGQDDLQEGTECHQEVMGLFKSLVTGNPYNAAMAVHDSGARRRSLEKGHHPEQ